MGIAGKDDLYVRINSLIGRLAQRGDVEMATGLHRAQTSSIHPDKIMAALRPELGLIAESHPADETFRKDVSECIFFIDHTVSTSS